MDDLTAIVEAAWPVWLVLWAGWVTQAVLAALLVRKFLHRRVMQGSFRVFDAHRPRAWVMVPFKGADDDLPAAIDALLTQDHDDYRLICIVESEDDPAYPILQRELARHSEAQTAGSAPDRVGGVVVAGRSPDDRGQKVHNLLKAIEHVDADSDDSDVWVFADSDAVPGPQWLGKMIGPLGTEGVGVATGYRWLIPEAGANIWSHLASVINSSVACFMGRDKMNHAWGGSMAMQVSTAREGDLKGWLAGAISDDYQVSRMCRHLGLSIHFVPECLVASPIDLTRHDFFNFTHRQHLITRIYAPWLFVGGIGVTGFYLFSFVTAWAMLGHYLYHDFDGGAWLIPLAAMLSVFTANLFRAHYRKQVIRCAFGTRIVQRMRRTLAIDRCLTPVCLGLHLLLLLRAALGRRIAWRGIEYQINAPQDVRRLPPWRAGSVSDRPTEQ